jgi:hypothetical protein
MMSVLQVCFLRAWVRSPANLLMHSRRASFKQLYEMEEGSLALAPIINSEPTPTADAVRVFLETGTHDKSLAPWVVDPDVLQRGQLVEVEIELRADPTFRVSAIVTAFKELAEESSELIGQADRQGFEKAIELNRVLEKLMGNLVPINCRLTNYEVIQVRGRKWLLHRRTLDQLPRESRPTTSPVFLVGVTEQSSYWKDIRRVLFSQARFRALCRLNDDGLQNTWTPVKMVDVLSEIAPTLVHEMGVFGSGALKAMVEGTATYGTFVEPRYKALLSFGDELARYWSIELDDEDRQEVEARAAETADMLTSVPDSRKAFTQISDRLAEKYGKTVDKETVAKLRVRACQKNGLYPGGSGVRAETVMFHDTEDEATEDHLDAEIVAIYW